MSDTPTPSSTPDTPEAPPTGAPASGASPASAPTPPVPATPPAPAATAAPPAKTDAAEPPDQAELIEAVLKKMGITPPEPEPPKNPAAEALSARIEADLAALSDEEKGLVLELGGDDPVSQSRIYTALLKAGKITPGSANAPAAPETPVGPKTPRIDVNPPGGTTPDDWKTATAAVRRALTGRHIR